jgi:hypothetical protein
VPTTRPRYQVTETPEVARALDAASRRWPGEPRSRLLLRLLAVGRDALEGEDGRRLQRRRRAVEKSSGKYAEAFTEHHLDELRGDWPS